MRHLHLLAALFPWLLLACGGEGPASHGQGPTGSGAGTGTGAGGSAPGGAGGAGTTTGAGGTGTGGDTTAGDPEDLALPPTTAVNNGRFATSPECKTCHSHAPNAQAMKDEAGQNIGFFDLWQASMMANSARDPLWRAVVSAEVAATPSQKEAIEAKCMRCHTPMASAEAELTGAPPVSIDLLGDGSTIGALALDGVSCAACHQIQPDGLGTPASFTGHFVIEPAGEMFGPHASPFAMPMVNSTGFTPKQAGHVTESRLCGSCHTLETDAYDASGQPEGMTLPEQTPYLEWRSSAFNDEGPSPGPLARTCQDCHVPVESAAGVPIVSRIARNPGGSDFPPVAPRSPFGRHLFIGGNTLVPALLREWPDILQPQAPPEAFDRTIALAREQLSMYSAKLEVNEATRDGDQIVVRFHLANLTGHKFPTAHPARRAWLRVVVTDSNGTGVFTSGSFDATGRILGAGGAVLPSEIAGGPALPHLDTVASPDDVYVLESVMGDADGQITYSLLRGASYLKDNRLLPQGFAPSLEDEPHVAPAGTASDPTFEPGGDVVTYRVPAPAAAGPYTVSATLLYAPLSARYADELAQWDTPQVKALFAMLEKVSRAPETVAETQVSVD